jgi:hypothetical protein
MDAAWQLLIGHWKAITGAIAGLVGIAVGIMQLVKLVAEYKDRKLARKTTTLSQIICIHAETVKKAHPSRNIVFSEEELRNALGKDGPRFHAVISLLMKEGRARKAKLRGYWHID